MISRALVLIVLSTTLPCITLPQGLVPAMGREFEFCEDRPLVPECLENIHARES